MTARPSLTEMRSLLAVEANTLQRLNGKHHPDIPLLDATIGILEALENAGDRGRAYIKHTVQGIRNKGYGEGYGPFPELTEDFEPGLYDCALAVERAYQRQWLEARKTVFGAVIDVLVIVSNDIAGFLNLRRPVRAYRRQAA